jgi:dipeptidyl aminopeptidase/acylaminoacyl peptidase
MAETITTRGTSRAMSWAVKRSSLVALTVLGLALLVAPAASASFPGHNGQIAFQSNRDGNADIYAMNPDGGCVTRLTEQPRFDGLPAWAPNGRRIAFQSNRDGSQEIYVMRADGSDQKRLTHNNTLDGGPAWSPNGRWIAFRSNRDGSPEIYVMRADGSEQRRLTRDSTIAWAPAWSPDGQRIAFAGSREDHDNPQIYVMNSNDGSQMTRLTFHPTSIDAAPSWSPDGQRIAFDSDREGSFDIWAMNTDGSGLTRLTDHPRVDGGPAWSPDGQRIAFRSLRARYNEIWTMNVDGSDQIRVTESPFRDRRPTWQSLRLPSNNFCLGRQRQNTTRGFVRQRVMVPGPGRVIVRRNERVMRSTSEAEEAGWTGVVVRPRGAARRRLDRAGTVQRRAQVNVRVRIAFRPEGGRASGEEVRVPLVKIRQP